VEEAEKQQQGRKRRLENITRLLLLLRNLVETVPRSARHHQRDFIWCCTSQTFRRCLATSPGSWLAGFEIRSSASTTSN